MVTAANEVLEHCNRRYRHVPLLRSVMLDQVEKLLLGQRAVFLEKPECKDLSEEILWICFSKGATLASPLHRPMV